MMKTLFKIADWWDDMSGYRRLCLVFAIGMTILNAYVLYDEKEPTIIMFWWALSLAYYHQSYVRELKAKLKKKENELEQ